MNDKIIMICEQNLIYLNHSFKTKKYYSLNYGKN